jgi:hypothetical protein
MARVKQRSKRRTLSYVNMTVMMMMMIWSGVRALFTTTRTTIRCNTPLVKKSIMYVLNAQRTVYMDLRTD